MLAVIRGDKPFAQELIKPRSGRSGININAKDKQENTALHFATLKQYLPVPFINLLLKNNAQVNVANKLGNTPLYYAVKIDNKQQRKQAVELLLKKDAHVSARNKRGETPLHIAIVRNDAIIVQLLYDQLKNKQGLTPLGFAKKLKRRELVRILGN